MGNQFHRATIELDRKMRLLDFGMYADGWKCNHCIFQTENLSLAKKHFHTHKKLEEFDIKL